MGLAAVQDSTDIFQVDFASVFDAMIARHDTSLSLRCARWSFIILVFLHN